MSEGAPLATPADSDAGAALTLRPAPLTILLVVFVLANAAQLLSSLLRREQMFRDIPRVTPLIYGAWLVAPAIGIAGALGLWFFRRWGLFAIVLGWLIVAAVDVWLGATANGIIATGMTWLIVLFCRPIRAALR